MDKKLLDELKKRLATEKTNTEEELKKIANKDEKLAGDWDTRFPKFDGNETGSAALEKAADEVEEFTTLLSIEYSLELKLKNIDSALEKIKKEGYGICEKCGKEMEEARLKTIPEARFCQTCNK